MINTKSGKFVVSPGLSKNDTRYWQSRVFKPKHIEGGTATSQTTCYFVRFQFAGRRISITLGTANQTEAAVRAKERFLFLSSNGWKAFLEKYKPEDRTPALVKRSNITVGEFISAATSESHLPLATINPYARAFRRIVSDIAGIRPVKKRFDIAMAVTSNGLIRSMQSP